MARDRIVPVKHLGSATAEPDYAGNIISTMLPMLLQVRFEPSSGKKESEEDGGGGGGGGECRSYQQGMISLPKTGYLQHRSTTCFIRPPNKSSSVALLISPFGIRQALAHQNFNSVEKIAFADPSREGRNII